MVDIIFDPGYSDGRSEDAYFASDDGCLLVVIDGATGLGNPGRTDRGTYAAWFSSKLAEEIATEYSKADGGFDLMGAIAKAGKRVSREFHEMSLGTEAHPADGPSAALAAAYADRKRGMLVCVALGDCDVIVKRSDGGCSVVTQPNLRALDAESIHMLAERMRKGSDHASAVAAMTPRLVEVRCKRNQLGGYWIADVEEPCTGYSNMVLRTMPLDDVDGVVVCSDGFENAINMGVCRDAKALVDACLEPGGCERVLEELRHAEDADAECAKVPRFKRHDDATAITATFRYEDTD